MKKKLLLISGIAVLLFGFTTLPEKTSVLNSINILDAYLRDYNITAAGITTLSGDYDNGFVFTTTEVDGSVSNELQTLAYNAGTGALNISGGNTVSVKTCVPYTGTTNASGLYTVTYSSAYATKPNVQAIFETTDPRDVVMLTSSTTTGFTLQVQRRVDVVGLLPTYSNRSGVTVNALVTPN